MRQIITDVDGLTEDLTNCVMVDGGKEYVWVGHIREAVTRYTRTITRKDIEAAAEQLRGAVAAAALHVGPKTQEADRRALDTLTTAALAADPDPLAAIRVLREWFASKGYPDTPLLADAELHIKAITQTEQEGR